VVKKWSSNSDDNKDKLKIVDATLDPKSKLFNKEKFCKVCQEQNSGVIVDRTCCNAGMLNRLDDIKNKLKSQIRK